MGLNWVLSLAKTILVEQSAADVSHECKATKCEKAEIYGFKMPLHYPRYVKSDYEKMKEERLDLLLRQYGLNFDGNLVEKRKFAMGAFLWPDQV